jgi:hypothetical protein
VSAEQTRALAEAARIAAENLRHSSESTRQANEARREDYFEKIVPEVADAISDMQSAISNAEQSAELAAAASNNAAASSQNSAQSASNAAGSAASAAQSAAGAQADAGIVLTRMNGNFVKDADFANENNTVAFKQDTFNPVTGTRVLETKAIPVATETYNGLMPKETVATVKDLLLRMAAQEAGVPIYAVNLPNGATQAQVQALFVSAAGVASGTVAPNLTKLVDVKGDILPVDEYESNLDGTLK